jgi:peptide/nickel transport system permease protein
MTEAKEAPTETKVPSGPQPGAGSAVLADREFTVRARSQTEVIFRRFLRHKLAVASLVLFVCVVLLAFVGGHFWRYKYDIYTDDLSQSPSLKHPFGTDSTGFDTFSQVLRGTQRSIEIALFVALASTIIGSIYGAVAGYFRGLVDSIMMRVVDMFLTFPILAVAALMGAKYQSKANGWFLIAVILAVLTWPYVSRIVRGVVLSLREKEYIEASRALGASNSRIIFRHLIPNAMGPIIVAVTILVALAILTETALSYVGFGVKYPDTSLGLLVSNGQTAIDDRPWLFYFPGLFIIIIALAVNFIGDGLRDAFDPQQTRVRA